MICSQELFLLPRLESARAPAQIGMNPLPMIGRIGNPVVGSLVDESAAGGAVRLWRFTELGAGPAAITWSVFSTGAEGLSWTSDGSSAANTVTVVKADVQLFSATTE